MDSPSDLYAIQEMSGVSLSPPPMPDGVQLHRKDSDAERTYSPMTSFGFQFPPQPKMKFKRSASEGAIKYIPRSPYQVCELFEYNCVI